VICFKRGAISYDVMEKKDPIDTELGIPSKNTEVVHVQAFFWRWSSSSVLSG